MGVLDVQTPEGVRAILSGAARFLEFRVATEAPDDHVASRFLAKAALEAMADKLIRAGLSYDYLVDEAQLDPVRRHAREGDPRVRWPYSIRRIYDADRAWAEPDGNVVQRVNEFDFLMTDQSEWYFVVAIFGLELAINLGGPEMEGYHRWLASHGDVSPLYYGKNASSALGRPPG